MELFYAIAIIGCLAVMFGPLGLIVGCVWMWASTARELPGRYRTYRQWLADLDAAKRYQRLTVAHLREMEEMARHDPIPFDPGDELALAD